MQYSKTWWKRNETDMLIAAVFLCMVAIAYTVGRVSAAPYAAKQVIIEVPDSVARIQEELEKAPLVHLATDTNGGVNGIPLNERRGEYVASKNGNYYYTADMSAALRIKAENRIWFTTSEEAAARGLKPAKGL